MKKSISSILFKGIVYKLITLDEKPLYICGKCDFFYKYSCLLTYSESEKQKECYLYNGAVYKKDLMKTRLLKLENIFKDANL